LIEDDLFLEEKIEMKELFALSLLSSLFLGYAYHKGIFHEMKSVAENVHYYENQNYTLMNQMRSMQAENNNLKSQLAKLKFDNEHLNMKTAELGLNTSSKVRGPSRSLASVDLKGKEDLVEFSIYQWPAEKLLAVAEKELFFKHYEKSAQFYHALLTHYPDHKIVTDEVVFQAGIAAFESKHHLDWAITHFAKVIESYPKSPFHRGSKLWLGLALHQTGDHEKFLATVEEFRLKYRNTNEWKVLSKYYEDIAFKFDKKSKKTNIKR
jgi:TolA-binding protein